MRYLIYIAPGIGDYMIALPLIETIKANSPEALIDIFTCTYKESFKLTQTLARLSLAIHDVFYYQKKELFHSIQMAWQLGYKNYDIGIVLEQANSEFHSKWPSKICAAACKKTVGAPNPYNGSEYTINLNRSDCYSIFEHELDILEALGFSRKFTDLSPFAIQPSFVVDGIIGYKPNIGLCVGANPVGNETNSISKKAWPMEYWIELQEVLVKEGYQVVLFGDATDAKHLQVYEERVAKETINLVGKTNILDALYYLGKMQIVVGADSGLVHSAAVQGVPTIALAGYTDYRIIKPFGVKSKALTSHEPCSPCYGTQHVNECTFSKCMYNIKVDDVLNAIQRSL